MSEERYTAIQDSKDPEFYDIFRDGERIRATVGTHTAEFLAQSIAEHLNQETAPLLERIAELESSIKEAKDFLEKIVSWSINAEEAMVVLDSALEKGKTE